MKNQILTAQKFIPQGDGMVLQTEIKRVYVNPEYARFKLAMEYSNTLKRIWYFSWEWTKQNVTEELAYDKLRHRIVNRKNPELYNFITVWMNLTNDLSTKRPNYNVECYTVRAGMDITSERRPVFLPNGNLDIRATRELHKLS